MKKILFLLLFTSAMYGQIVPTGQEQDFDYGIKNTASQLDDNAVFITVQNSDGVQGKSTSSVWAKKIYVDNADVKKSFLSTGLIKNGLVQANADPTKFNITAGIGIISNFDDPENPTSTIVNFPAFTGITPTYLTSGNITYIAINSSATIVQQATPFTNIQRRDLIALGAVIHSNLTTINLVNNISAPTNAGINQLHDLMEAIGALNVDGNKIVANNANLSINKTAGDIFKLGVNFANDWKNPHKLNLPLQTLATFRYRTQNGTEGANVTVLNPALYDVANVLTSVPSNRFSIQTVTLFQTGAIRVQYGQATYSTLSEAEAAITTRSYNVEANIAANGITRAYIILKNTATSLQNASDTKIVEAGKFGNVGGSGGAITLDAIVAALGYTPANDVDVVKKFIKSNESLSLAQRKGDVLYGILDQYTGEEITLSKVTGTPTVDGIIYFQLGSEYFKRNTDGIFNVKWFDAKGDGTTDDTVSIQKAIDIAIAGTEIFIPNGVYMIKATGDLTSGVDGGLRINKSLKIHLDLKTTLKAITGNKNQGQVLYCYDTSGIEIYGGEIIGDRDTNTNLAEWGHGIEFWNVSKIYVHDIKVSKCKGDNIVVGTNAIGLNYDTVIERVIFDSPRRWGFTYASGGKRLTIRDCVFQNFTTDLGFGGCMDLEEHYATDEMNDVTIDGCKFINTTSPNGDITIQGYNLKNWKIINNSFLSTIAATLYGINLGATISINSALISGNSFSNYSNSITVSSPNTEGLIVSENKFNNLSTGIQIGGSAGSNCYSPLFNNNNFKNTVTCINQSTGSIINAIISNNTFDTYTNSTNINGVGTNVISNNFLNSASGISLGFDKSNFSNNFIKNCSEKGIASFCSNSSIKNNTIIDCGVGIQYYASNSNNIIEGNNIINSTSLQINAPSPSLNKSYFIYNNLNGGSKSITNHFVVSDEQLMTNIASGGVGLKLYGNSLDGSIDQNGGYILGLNHNSAGNRQFFIGATDSPQKLIFAGRGIEVYNSTTGLYESLSLNSAMKSLNIGFATNSALVAVSNHTGSASSKVMVLEGISGQTGDYLNILERGGAVKVSVNSAGNLLIPSATISTAPTTSAGTYDILTRNSSTGVVEKVTSTSIAPTASPTFTGIPTAPTATVGTNTTQIATTAFVQGIRPYKVYTALLSQTGTSAPTATVLENTLGGTVVWTYSTVGGYIGTLTGAFTNNKTSVLISNGQAANALFGSYRLSDNAVGLFTTTAGTGAAVDGAIFNATIEIRVYN